MLRDLLTGRAIAVGRRHVRTLMLRMGIEALAPQPSTSQAAPGHKIYPYLLRKLAITRPIRSGHWTRHTFRWRAASSTSLRWWTWPAARCWRTRWRSRWSAVHATEVIEQAFARYGTPEIVNTDQGSQFTAEEFTRSVLARGCKLSMDGTRRVARQRVRRAAVAQREV